MLFVGHKVSRWEKNKVLNFTEIASCQTFNLTDAVNLITEKFDTKGVFIAAGRENLDYITAYTEFPTLEINVISLKLDINQVIEQLISRNFLAWTKTNRWIGIFFGRTQTVNTRNGSHNDNIITFK